jgi:NADH-quinone oxidoreductase subunit J
MGLNQVLLAFASVFALASALCVVFTRRTNLAALWFVTHLMSLAVIYALLDAPLLAALQVMVYAGAVVVVFIFAIMILDADEQDKLTAQPGWQGLAALGASGVLLASFFGYSNKFEIAKALAPAGQPFTGDNTKALALVLFRDYLPAFELAGVLLLVAVVGILVMAKRKLE